MHSCGINQTKQTPTSRRGTLLIIVLACIAVISLLLAAIAKGTMDWRRQVRYETWNAQAEWLAESGVDKAVAALQKDAAYTGETWQLEESDGLLWNATVEIDVQRSPESQTINVIAAFAEETGRPVRATRTLKFSEAQDNKNE